MAITREEAVALRDAAIQKRIQDTAVQIRNELACSVDLSEKLAKAILSA